MEEIHLVIRHRSLGQEAGTSSSVYYFIISYFVGTSLRKSTPFIAQVCKFAKNDYYQSLAHCCSVRAR